MVKIPPALVGRPFTVVMAEQAGLNRQALEGRRFHRLFRGVYVLNGTELSLATRMSAALLTLPQDAVVSHTTAAAVYGLAFLRHSDILEFSTNTNAVTSQRGILLHRRQATLHPVVRSGVLVTGPDRSFVDCATRLSFIELVQFGDWLLHIRATTPEALFEFAMTRHFDGVRRARRALLLVRERVESPRETLVRLLVVFARLPEPETNLEIHDDQGNFVARVDMAYREWRVVIEYDGQQHERDPRQRQRDRERREALEALGWRVIIVTNRDLLKPEAIPWRVFHALARAGYTGREPLFNSTWSGWFATK